MILLDDVVEVLRLTQLDVGFMFSVVAGDRGGVRSAFVDDDLVGLAVQRDGALQEFAGRGAVTLGSQ